MAFNLVRIINRGLAETCEIIERDFLDATRSNRDQIALNRVYESCEVIEMLALKYHK